LSTDIFHIKTNIRIRRIDTHRDVVLHCIKCCHTVLSEVQLYCIVSDAIVLLPITVRDYSASDGSDGTNEEPASSSAAHKQKKKRSLRSKKKSATLEHDLQLSWTDTDIVGQQRKISLDEEAAGRDMAAFAKVGACL